MCKQAKVHCRIPTVFDSEPRRTTPLFRVKRADLRIWKLQVRINSKTIIFLDFQNPLRQANTAKEQKKRSLNLMIPFNQC